jgi:beta-barrel assembly-enhancing protease
MNIILPLAMAAALPDPSLRALQALDARVTTIAYHIATRNVARCDRKAALSGIAVHSLGQYTSGSRAAAVATFGLGAEAAVLAVARDSPAEKAGIRADDRIMSVNGQSMAEVPSPKASMETVVKTRAALGAAAIRLTIERNGAQKQISFANTLGCVSTAEMIPSNSMSAEADGDIVQITSALVEYVQSNDELAFVIAHEMAHNILAHPAKLDKIGRKRANILATEIEADKMALHLMNSARYDIYAAPAFWARFGKLTGFGIFSDGTHLRTKARVQMLRDEIARITAQPATP